MRTARVEPTRHRPGLDLSMGAGHGSLESPTWAMGGWRIRFLRLDPHDSAPVPHGALVKVVTGALERPARRAYPPVGVVRPTTVDADDVTAGSDGALVMVLDPSGVGSEPVTAMEQLGFTGPFADVLQWQTFESKYHAATSFFDGADAYLAPGFHLLDASGDEIAYVFVWTAGTGVDLSTHNHGRTPGPTSPAFAEVHLVLHNGTGRGGMYQTPEPGSPVRHRTPMQRGDEHGPFFAFDPVSGAPRLRDNGAVEYPWHGWEAGTDGAPGQAYDVVVAFEITVPYARVVPE